MPNVLAYMYLPTYLRISWITKLSVQKDELPEKKKVNRKVLFSERFSYLEQAFSECLKIKYIQLIFIILLYCLGDTDLDYYYNSKRLPKYITNRT